MEQQIDVKSFMKTIITAGATIGTIYTNAPAHSYNIVYQDFAEPHYVSSQAHQIDSLQQEHKQFIDAIAKRIEEEGSKVIKQEEELDEDGNRFVLFYIENDDPNFNPIAFNIELLNKLGEENIILPEKLFIEFI